MKMPVTIKEIAKVAGVSHTTVSRALNDNPVISADTTQRIQELARKMGYVPSAVAQSLRGRKTFTVGMVVTSLDDPFFGRVVGGVEQVARAANYSVFLSTSHNQPEQELAVVESLYRRRVDAIIITSMRVDSVYHQELDNMDVPVVLINNQTEGEFHHSVAVDDVQGSQAAVEHLLQLGHRRIGYVGTPNHPRSNRERFDGYRRAHEHLTIPLDQDLALTSTGSDFVERGRTALTGLLEAGATAAFCYNDLTAVGLMTACRERRVRIPEDFSIVGYDDLELSSYVTPSLTTVHQPRLRMGKLAMQMTLDLLNQKSVRLQLLPCDFVERESTAAPRDRV